MSMRDACWIRRVTKDPRSNSCHLGRSDSPQDLGHLLLVGKPQHRLDGIVGLQQAERAAQLAHQPLQLDQPPRVGCSLGVATCSTSRPP